MAECNCLSLDELRPGEKRKSFFFLLGSAVRIGHDSPLFWSLHFILIEISLYSFYSFHACKMSSLDWVPPRCVSSKDILYFQLCVNSPPVPWSQQSEHHCLLIPVTSSQKGFVYGLCHLPGLFLKPLICTPKWCNWETWITQLLVWNMDSEWKTAPNGIAKAQASFGEGTGICIEHVFH